MKLRDLASVIRSKNAGPFIVTLDVFFETDADFNRVTDAAIFTKQSVAELYKVEERHVQGIFHLRDARGIKVTFVKPSAASGDPGLTDMYACQQHAPLLDLEV